MSQLKVGDQIPVFTSVLHDGTAFTQNQMVGKKHILTFYGQDDSPTCNKQVFTVGEVADRLSALGYTVLGVSRDTYKKHQKFIAKYNIPYGLISDESTEMMKAFNAFGPKMFMGKEVQGVYRKAYIIDDKGKISHIIDDVVSAQHGTEILQALGI
jgi:thioredoxin-dependent peroxiredoxin